MMELLPIVRRYGPWLIGVGILAFLVDNWVSANADKARMSATISAQNEVIKGYKATIDELDQRMADREEAVKRQLEGYEAVIRRVQTPQQIIREVPQYLPALPKPIETQVTPEGKVQAVIPEEDLKPLFDMVVQAKAQAVQLETAKLTIVDLQEKVTVLEKRIEATEVQRDAAVKAAKGGGVWRRTGRALKWVVVGVGIGITLGRL